MLRFFAGIFLVQMASVLLVVVSRPTNNEWTSWLPIVVALAVIGLVAAFWFANLALHQRRDEIERMRIEFAHERERLRVQAERDKTKLVRKNQKTLVTETRRAEKRANLKVGVAVAAATGVGMLMILTNFMTLGLLLMTAAGSALGGYLLRRDWIPRLPRPGQRQIRHEGKKGGPIWPRPSS